MATALERIDFDYVMRDPIASGRTLIERLRTDRAIVVHVAGLEDLYRKSVELAKEFFALPEEVKRSAIWGNTGSSRGGNEFLDLVFLGKRYSGFKCTVNCKERGWVPPGMSNSGVQKEYFQYGLEYESSGVRPVNLVENAWPSGRFGREFKSAKLEFLEFFCKVHLGLFQSFSFHLDAGTRGAFYSWPANIICRDTHYLPVVEHNSADCPASYAIRNSAHVDLGEGTLIAVEQGLQICVEDNSGGTNEASLKESWVDIDYRMFGPNELLYIPGLALEIRSNGCVKATWHRVVSGDFGRASKSRYSLVSFGNAGIDDILEPYCLFRGLDSESVYRPIRRDLLPILGGRGYMDACLNA